jgi:Kef-type K+ transport system membrane component KefB
MTGQGEALALTQCLSSDEFTFYLFLAVIIGISALPVLARILSEYRLLSTPLGVFTINCTTVDDIIAWPVLSLALALNGSSSWRGVVYTILLVLGHCAIVVLLLRPVLRYIVGRAARQAQLSHFYLFLIMLIMLLNAWLLEIIGLSALIGAMEIGILMPRNNHVVGQLSSRIEDLVVVVFLPLFFTVSGLRTQLTTIDSLQLWGLTALLTFATCFSKILGSLPPARYIGKLSWRDSITFGCLMNTKGLVALVAINLGLNEGLITEKLFSMLVIMVLFNTFLTCPLVWLVFRIFPKPKVAEPIALTTFDSSNRDAAERNKTTVMISPQSAQIAPLLTVLGASFYPAIAPKGKLYLLRLVPAADRPSYYMGDYKKKAVA